MLGALHILIQYDQMIDTFHFTLVERRGLGNIFYVTLIALVCGMVIEYVIRCTSVHGDSHDRNIL